ncbi:MAG: xylose isomerase [Spirochaetales bacterium]|nr:xylose isomerase [Spirochaetales bacterium]
MSSFIGKKEYFPGIGPISYEGPQSDNPLAFKFYNPSEKIGKKTMADHLRFAVAYWHSFNANGTDPFGAATIQYPWDGEKNPLAQAEMKADGAFEFITKLGTPFYCFHDVDAAPDAESVAEYEKNLQTVVAGLKARQAATGVKLLWNTANMFSHPRYMNGAATNPDFRVLARAAAQVKVGLDVATELGAQNYVFWGGREGYTMLMNTNMKREQEHLAKFLTLARDYGRSIGFKGTFLIEPKPMEPSKHQYDFDSATVIGFLRYFGLDKDFKLNIEANHATLSGHEFAHDLQVAADAGLLGSIDANRGDDRNGWDTDQFPTDVYQTTQAMLVLLGAGGFATGGLNFDAKRRRNSTDPADLFYAHIGGMDSFALGLRAAQKIIDRGLLKTYRDDRYASFDTGKGKDFEDGKINLKGLYDLAKSEGASIPATSGKQELLENLVNQVLFG